MDRLTEYDLQGNPMLRMEGCSWIELLTKLAHYEDMEEAGRLIEVVRCDDCCHQQYCKQAQYLGADGYCSKAELKELEGE